MKKWQLQEAKARLSQLVKEASADGPQSITVHGKLVVVVISKKEYERMKKPKVSFLTFIRESPLVGADLDLTRDKSLTRDTDL